MFDPLNDFETRGYLRNLFGERDPSIIKHLEHSSFVEGVAEAFQNLSSSERLSYQDVLDTHKILFGDMYPWAGQDRLQTVPNIAVSKGDVLFAHPKDMLATVEYALKIGNDTSLMARRPGEVMGHLAYAHPFLDGNGRTIMVIHTELAQRAGISIEWAETNKVDYLTALTKEIDEPGAHLDTYLKPFLRDAVGIGQLAGHVVNTRGLDGHANELADDNKVLGSLTDPALQSRYQQQELRRRKFRGIVSRLRHIRQQA